MSTTSGLPSLSTSHSHTLYSHKPVTPLFFIVDDLLPTTSQSIAPSPNALPLDYIPTCVEIYEFPLVVPWKFPLMHKIGNNGVMYLWQIGFDGSNLLISHGTHGSMTLDPPTKVTENSSGKSMLQQGYQEALSKFRNKFYDGYIRVGSTETPMIKAMKGVPYKQGSVKKFPVLISPKLDGIRILISISKTGDISFRTRLNRSLTHFTTIEEQIKKILMYLPPGCTLDTEFYCHGMNLQQIISAVKTTERIHPDLDKIKCNIFDIFYPENPPSEIRYQLLYSIFSKMNEEDIEYPNLALVPQYLVHSHEQIIATKDHFVKCGFEGAFFRLCANGAKPGTKEYEMSQYKPGRCTRAFKVKDFQDEEGIIVGVVAAEGSEQGLALLVIRDKLNIETVIRFGAAEDRLKWMGEPRLVIGKKFTFKFVNRGENGKPRQPTGVGFRDYE